MLPSPYPKELKARKAAASGRSLAALGQKMIRLNAFRVGYKGNGKIFRVKDDNIANLLDQARKALNCPNGKEIFNADGAEVEEVDLLDDKEKVYLSSGESFVEPTRVCTGSFVWYRQKTSEIYSYFAVEDADELTYENFVNHLSKQLSVPSTGITISLEKEGDEFEPVEGDIAVKSSYLVQAAKKTERTSSKSATPTVSSPLASSSPVRPVLTAKEAFVRYAPPESDDGDDGASESDLSSVQGDNEEWTSIRTLRIAELINRTEELHEQLAHLENDKQLQEVLEDQGDDMVAMTVTILKDHFASQYFHSFLKRIVCEENLLFYNAITRYQDYPSLKSAMEIYHQFVEKDAQFQVNLSSDIIFDLEKALRRHLKKESRQKKVMSQMEKLKLTQNSTSSLSLPDSPAPSEKNDEDVMFDPDLFEEAQDCIIRLIATDSLPKFLDTKEYKNMKKNMTRKQSKAERRVHPLHLAAQKGQVSAVETALEAGALIELRNELGDTPMHLAASQGRVKVIEVLYKHSAEIDPLNDQGDTPLAVAAAYGSLKACKFLLMNGADVNSVNRVGDTPLHHGARSNVVSVCKLLIDQGAGMDTRNAAGKTPLHVATKKIDALIKSMLFKPLLKDYSTKVVGEDLITWTPLWSVHVDACDVEHQQLFEYINLLWKMIQSKGNTKKELNLLPILASLVDYTVFHFENEEEMMKRSDLPLASFKKHHKEHVKFTKQVTAFYKQFRKGEVKLDSKLLNFLKSWLMNHIKKTDMEYHKYVNEVDMSM